MGNSPACLSSAHCHQEDADLLIRVASRRADELCKPLLKPCILHNDNDQRKTKLYVSAAAIPKTTGDNLKVIKKVRFCDELTLTSTSNQKSDPLVSTHANEGAGSEEVLHAKKNESSILINPSAALINQSSIVVNQSSNIVRVKVVISKKQLSELILKTREKLGSDALMERILGPLLPPQSSINKLSNTQHGNPTWRPSLEHISEDH